MTKKYIVVFGLLLVGLTVVSMLDESHVAPPDNGNRVFAGLRVDELNELVLGAGQRLVVKLRNTTNTSSSGFVLVEPAPVAPVNPVSLQQFFAFLQAMTYKKQLGVAHASAEDFGFSNTSKRLELGFRNGSRQTLVLGGTSPVGSDVYVRFLEQDQTVFVVSKQFELVFNRRRQDFL